MPRLGLSQQKSRINFVPGSCKPSVGEASMLKATHAQVCLGRVDEATGLRCRRPPFARAGSVGGERVGPVDRLSFAWVRPF